MEVQMSVQEIPLKLHCRNESSLSD